MSTSEDRFIDMERVDFLVETLQSEKAAGFQATPPALRNYQPTSSKWKIVGLTAFALIPAVSCAVFALSLGLHSRNGLKHGSTFVRPIEDGLVVKGFSISPLLVSSISSTFIGDISVFVTSLLAFQLAYRWLRASSERSKSLPPPSQFSLIFHMVSYASYWSFFHLTKYVIQRKPSDPPSPHPARGRRQREPLTGLLPATAAGLTLILSLSLGIVITDIFLHQTMVSTVVYQNETVFINGSTFVATGCGDEPTWACPVFNRSAEASSGGRNASAFLSVYEIPYDPSQASTAFVGPVVTDSSIVTTGPTVVTATSCSISPVTCPSIGFCWSNNSQWGVRFDVEESNYGPQILLTSGRDLLDMYTGIPPAYGAAENPINITGFMSFTDYSNIVHSETNVSLSDDVPFVNWWTIQGALEDRDADTASPQLLFAFDCAITVYDASYSLSDGVISLQADTLSLANVSTAYAITAPLVWLGDISAPELPDLHHFPTTRYARANRYIDEQVQVDITAAGNMYGNSTDRFAAALAQSLSNRLAGWSAGAITMEPLAATSSHPVLSIRIPLVTASIFIGLHGAYALGIMILGISCFFLPKSVPQPRPSNFLDLKLGRATPDIGTNASPRAKRSDLAVAQLRLSDASALVHDYVHAQKSANTAHVRNVSFDSTASPHSPRSPLTPLTPLTLGSSTHSRTPSVEQRLLPVERAIVVPEERSVRVSMRPDAFGALRLQAL